MMTIYIVRDEAYLILSINQSIEGAAKFAWGLGQGKIDDQPFTYQAIVEKLEHAPSVEIAYDEGVITIERQFVAP